MNKRIVLSIFGVLVIVMMYFFQDHLTFCFLQFKIPGKFVALLLISIFLVASTLFLSFSKKSKREVQMRQELSPDGDVFLHLITPFHNAICELEKIYLHALKDREQIGNQISSLSNKDNREKVIKELKDEELNCDSRIMEIKSLFIQIIKDSELFFGKVKFKFLLQATPVKPDTADLLVTKSKSRIIQLIQEMENYQNQLQEFVVRHEKLEKPIIESVIPIDDKDRIAIHETYKSFVEPIQFHLDKIRTILDEIDLQIDTLKVLQHKVDNPDFSLETLDSELQKTIRKMNKPSERPSLKLPDVSQLPSVKQQRDGTLNSSMQQIIRNLSDELSSAIKAFNVQRSKL